MKTKERKRFERRYGLIGHTSMSSDEGMAACGFLGLFMTRKVVRSLSKVSRTNENDHSTGK